jgi:hypothetical protein
MVADEDDILAITQAGNFIQTHDETIYRIAPEDQGTTATWHPQDEILILLDYTRPGFDWLLVNKDENEIAHAHVTTR